MRRTLPTFNEVWQRQFRSSVLSQLQTFPAQTKFLIGCSGGMDSMLLLHLLSFLCPEKVRAIYIDHQLQSPSAAWGELVQTTCHSLNVPCALQKVSVAEGNLENQARQARYHAYMQHLDANEVLVLAHHQQDQAETVLLRLLSGTGVHGLAAMQAIDVRENLTIWRPLLDVSREQICQWCAVLKLDYVQDPSNQDVHYDRAWSREILWPVLQQRFPKMQQAVTRTASLMQDAEKILAEVLAQDLAACGTNSQLNLIQLQQLSLPRQRQLLSAWMKGQAQYRPSFDMVERLQREVIQAKADAQAAVRCQDYYYLRYQQQLFRLPKAEYLAVEHFEAVEQDLLLQADQPFQLWSGCYQLQPAKVGLCSSLLNKTLTLRPRLGGEKIHLYGRVGAWPLKKAIQEAQIFPWTRHTIQILSLDNVMLGVFSPKGFWLAQSDYCVADGWQPNLVS
ncbi:MAG: tRNA lysidine(34) synthetase TilS [Gammaproteobacteria bacterium]|nr:tRNA lysidine(34) synthetase TilS [Gammaproteobacteria bacterium]